MKREAHHYSLLLFAGEAYNVEMGITNQLNLWGLAETKHGPGVMIEVSRAKSC